MQRPFAPSYSKLVTAALGVGVGGIYDLGDGGGARSLHIVNSGAGLLTFAIHSDNAQHASATYGYPIAPSLGAGSVTSVHLDQNQRFLSVFAVAATTFYAIPGTGGS